MLLHPYHDGNGRTFYILTNLLLHQNQLKPTHLKNMCLYEGLTVERLVREVIEGQERFEAHFGSLDELSNGLYDYETAVLQLQKLKKIDLCRSHRNIHFLKGISTYYFVKWRQAINKMTCFNS